MRLVADDFIIPALTFIVAVWSSDGEPLFLARCEGNTYRFIFSERGYGWPPGGLGSCRYDGNVDEAEWLIADLAGVWEPHGH